MLLKWEVCEKHKLVSLWDQTLKWLPWSKPTFFPCDLPLCSLQRFQTLWCCVCQQEFTRLQKWMLELCCYFFNMAFEFLSAFISEKQWHHEYQGQLPRHPMPRDNEGDRRLCSLLMSTQSLWFCIWNRDVKLVARRTVKKKPGWITQVLIYFVPALLLFLLQWLFYCHYQGH